MRDFPRTTPLLRLFVCSVLACASLVVFSASSAEAEVDSHTLDRLQLAASQLSDSKYNRDEFVREVKALSAKVAGGLEAIRADKLASKILMTAIYNRAFDDLGANPSVFLKRYETAAEVIFGKGSKQAEQIKHLIYLVERVEIIDASGDAVKMQGLLEEAQTDEERQFVNRRSRDLLLRLASENVIGGKNPGLAIRYLAELDPFVRTSQVRDLTTQALKQIAESVQSTNSAGSFWPFSDKAVRDLVERIEYRDASASEREVLRDLLARIYSWRVVERVRANDIREAQLFFDETIKRRPDPDSANNSLRYEIAVESKTPEAIAFAKMRIGELSRQGEMSWSLRTKLLMSGFYSKYFPIAVIALLCLGVGYFVYLLKSPSSSLYRRTSSKFAKTVKRQERKSGAYTVLREEGDAIGVRSGFDTKATKGSGYRNVSSSMDEYSALLELFELTDAATEEDIKKSYRQKMKDYHPDKMIENTEQEKEEAARRFDELKRAYDRILEMKRSRFGG